MPPAPLTRLRALCLAFPEAHEVEAWEAPTFRVRNRIFAMYAAPNTSHKHGEHPAVWVKTDAFTQRHLIASDPARYFSPPYVGPGGWTGVRLDGVVPWRHVTELLRDAYVRTAPKRLAAQLDRPRRPAR